MNHYIQVHLQIMQCCQWVWRIKNQFVSGCSMVWRLILLYDCYVFGTNILLTKSYGNSFFVLNFLRLNILIFNCMFLFHMLRAQLFLFNCLYWGIFNVSFCLTCIIKLLPCNLPLTTSFRNELNFIRTPKSPLRGMSSKNAPNIRINFWPILVILIRIMWYTFEKTTKNLEKNKIYSKILLSP